jgi:hypothetical protein
MTESETRMILGQVSALDNRKLTDAMVLMWFSLFGGYSYNEVKWALMYHARTSTEYITPAHLLQIVNEKRAEWRMMNPTKNLDRDSWLDFEHQQELAALEARRIRASGVRSAVEAMESGEYDTTPEGDTP